MLTLAPRVHERAAGFVEGSRGLFSLLRTCSFQKRLLVWRCLNGRLSRSLEFRGFRLSSLCSGKVGYGTVLVYRGIGNCGCNARCWVIFEFLILMLSSKVRATWYRSGSLGIFKIDFRLIRETEETNYKEL